MADSFRRLGRAMFTPHVIAFGIITVPICIMAYQMRPAQQSELNADLRKRYGYQHFQQQHAVNTKVMEQIFENRHKHISEYTAGFQQTPTPKSTDDKAASK